MSPGKGAEPGFEPIQPSPIIFVIKEFSKVVIFPLRKGNYRVGEATSAYVGDQETEGQLSSPSLLSHSWA